MNDGAVSCYGGRVTAVTGAASGIGAATARALVGAGAVVYGLDRTGTALPDGVRPLPIDLADPASIAVVADALGAIDALFNCAGLPPTRPPIDVIRVNFLGLRELADRVAERMAPGSAIVSTSSNGGLLWRERLPMLRDFLAATGFSGGLAWAEANIDAVGHAYRFTKEAITVWTMTAAQTLIARGIRINCTSPGAVSTPMLDEIERAVPAAAVDVVARPIGRRSSPEEQAAVLLFLGSDAASYINGVDLPVDGGFAAQAVLPNKTEEGRKP